MSFNGITINKAAGGIARNPNTSDRVVLLVCGATAVAGLAHYATTELQSIEDLEALNITADSDLAIGELTHYHVSEVFRLSPAQSLHLMLVPDTEKISTLLVKNEFVAGVRAIDGINTIGIAGMTADLTADVAIKAAQVFVDELAADYIYIDNVMLEGVGSYVPTAIATLTDNRTLDSENVSMVIAQDPAQAALNEVYASHAAVGSALGMLSVRAIHENIGSVDIEKHPSSTRGSESYPLTDSTKGKWVTAALSNGVLVSSISLPNQKLINTKGYIFAGCFNGYAGYYFSNSPTCTLETSDYAYIEYVCVWNKGSRIIRNTMLPRIRSKVKADPTTGFIASTTISDWDARIRRALEPMVSAGNISDFDIYINPNQAAVSDKPFAVKVQLVADGIVNEFEVSLGLTSKI